jgi:hypothetical protein
MPAKIWSTLKRLNHFDPLGAFSKRLFWGSPLLTALMVGLLLVAGWWMMGEYSKDLHPTSEAICSAYPQIVCPKNLTIVYQTDPAELAFALFLWGIFVPVTWWYCLSMPNMWNKLLTSLARENVIDSRGLKQVLTPALESSFWMPSFLISVFVMALYFWGSLPSEIELGRASFWALTLQGRVMVTAYVGINTFVVISFVLRTLILIAVTGHFFAKHGIKEIHVFHVDRCGGFGAIGALATQISSLAVFMGLWAVWYSALPALSGGNMNFGITVILLYSAYAILVPLLLIALTRPVSLAMKRHKQQLLMKVSVRLQEELDLLINRAGSDQMDEFFAQGKSGANRYQNLQQLYEQLSQIPESPIRLLNLKRFTGFAIFPAIFGSISFMLNVFDLFSKINGCVNN